MQNLRQTDVRSALLTESPFRVAQEYKDAHEIERYVAKSRNHRYAQRLYVRKDS